MIINPLKRWLENMIIFIALYLNIKTLKCEISNGACVYFKGNDQHYYLVSSVKYKSNYGCALYCNKISPSYFYSATYSKSSVFECFCYDGGGSVQVITNADCNYECSDEQACGGKNSGNIYNTFSIISVELSSRTTTTGVQTTTMVQTTIFSRGTTTTAAKKSKVKLTTSSGTTTTTATTVSCSFNCSNLANIDCFCIKTKSNLTYTSDYDNTSSSVYISFVAAYKLQVRLLFQILVF